MDAASQRDLTVLSLEPANLESIFSRVPLELTPTPNFFVRNHFPVPPIDRDAWMLALDGAVERPLNLSLRALQAMRTASYTCVLECAGNGRRFLAGHDEGLQWGLGAVGCARFTGVPLRDVLSAAGPLAEAVEVVFAGADHGLAEKTSKPKSEIHFARSLPLATALGPEVLLAWEMNGAPLSPEHGAPVRLVVPGWYSVASVKWLRGITVVRQPFRGYFQTVEYAYWTHAGGTGPERVPVTELRVKSQIAHPALHEQVPAGKPCAVYGVAWSSGAAIAKVEVSCDGGSSWQTATLEAAPENHAWRRWDWTWNPDELGEQTLMARATDATGQVQPAEHDQDHEGYQIHHTLLVPVEVV